MRYTKVTAVYFSATNNTEKSVQSIAKVFDTNYTNLNLTRFDSDLTKKEFGSDELMIIRAPVYGGRIYQGAMKRFQCLKGNQTPCIAVVTYGNRDYDDALLELKDTMNAQGFIVVGAATLVGEHTYGTIQKGRPDDNDLMENTLFSLRLLKRILLDDLHEVNVPGNHPYRDGGNGGRFVPSTKSNCMHCGICAKLCPEGAISEDCQTIDSTKCIACFSCIKHCPVKAKVMDSPQYEQFATAFSQKLALRRENKYFF